MSELSPQERLDRLERAIVQKTALEQGAYGRNPPTAPWPELRWLFAQVDELRAEDAAQVAAEVVR